MENSTDHIPIRNKPLPNGAEEKIALNLSEGEKVLFCIVGDLSLDVKYENTVMAVTDRQTVFLDSAHPDGVLTLIHSDVKEITVKRMYGKERMNTELKSGEKMRLFRYTYALSDLCGAAAEFIGDVGKGGEVDEKLQVVSSAWEKKKRVWPSAGARCCTRARSALPVSQRAKSRASC